MRCQSSVSDSHLKKKVWKWKVEEAYWTWVQVDESTLAQSFKMKQFLHGLVQLHQKLSKLIKKSKCNLHFYPTANWNFMPFPTMYPICRTTLPHCYKYQATFSGARTRAEIAYGWRSTGDDKHQLHNWCWVVWMLKGLVIVAYHLSNTYKYGV